MSSPRWLEHFALQAAPFDKDLADGQLWVPSSREPLVERLVEACQERGHALLTGEPGVGKTCVLRALRHRLPEAGFRLTYSHSATLGRRDFYRQLCLALGLNPKATAAAVFYEVSSHIEQLGQERVHPVFLLDEAHLLHQDVLDPLYILANYEWDSRPLLSILLVGLPEMRERMHVRRNRSLGSRVHTRLHLGEAQPDDTAEYLEHRLRLVGPQRSRFSADALSILHEASGGRLRDIDRIATDALKRAARRKLNKVDHAIVQLVLGDDSLD